MFAFLSYFLSVMTQAVSQLNRIVLNSAESTVSVGFFTLIIGALIFNIIRQNIVR